MAVDKKGKQLPPGIRQRANGRYEGRVKVEYRSYSVYADTITETKKKMRELKYKLDHGLFVEKEKITLDEWNKTWMVQYKKNRVKNSTYNSYQKYYKGAISKRLGKKNIVDIRGEHIQSLYNDLVKEEWALSSIKVVAAVLNGCFQQALKNGLIERNPVKLAELPRQKERKERQAMTKEQQALFMEYAKESYLYNFFAVMLRTGMRSGELKGLKYTDIDKKENVIHVQRTLKYIEGQGYLEDTPKTRTSTRDIPLTEDILALLENQKGYWGFKVERLDRYLFCNEEGKPLSRERVQAEIDRTIKRIRAAGHDFPRITSHALRHTFCSRCFEKGITPKVVQQLMGHAHYSTTIDI